eukprot:SAG25_NODE_3132_length_1203_cov_1.230072_2_plen_295_part_01
MDQSAVAREARLRKMSDEHDGTAAEEGQPDGDSGVVGSGSSPLQLAGTLAESQAPPDAAADTAILEEKRIDPSDGSGYTYQEFLEAYGDNGPALWEQAVRVEGAPASQLPKADEKRTDQSDGSTYTYQEFLDAYGPGNGPIAWERAGRLEEEPAPATTPAPSPVVAVAMEKRVDPSDRNEYTYQEFLDAYGPDNGPIAWKQAERRVDPADGNLYSLYDFLTAYGEEGGRQAWDRAGKVGPPPGKASGDSGGGDQHSGKQAAPTAVPSPAITAVPPAAKPPPSPAPAAAQPSPSVR